MDVVHFSCSFSLSRAPIITRDSVYEQSKCIAFNLSKRKPTASLLQAPQCVLSWGFCRLLDTREVGASERQSLWRLVLNPTRQDCPSGASNSITQRFPTKTAKKGLTQLTLTLINAQVTVITDFTLTLAHTVISEEVMQCCSELTLRRRSLGH